MPLAPSPALPSDAAPAAPAPAASASAPRRLTDRAALLAHRARARRQGPALPLHDFVADEIEDRLAEVNRTFTDIALASGFPEAFADRFPGARLLEDAPDLGLAPASCDLVLHLMALHWADDPVGQLVQCARALRPDGLLIAALPGGESLAALRRALAEAEIAETGGLSPRVLPMGELRDWGALPARAGLALPVADLVPVTLSYAGPLALMRELRAMGEGNALADRLRRPTRRGVIARAAAAYAAACPDPAAPGRVLARVELIFLTAWAPAPGQPRPLRPGSARMSLAEALAPTSPRTA